MCIRDRLILLLLLLLLLPLLLWPSTLLLFPALVLSFQQIAMPELDNDDDLISFFCTEHAFIFVRCVCFLIRHSSNCLGLLYKTVFIVELPCSTILTFTAQPLKDSPVKN